MNGSLPDKIEDLVKCSDVNLAGLVGSVLSTACGTDLLALLPMDALSGLGVLDGALGKSADAKAPSAAEGSDPAAVPVSPMVPDGLPVSVASAEALQDVVEPISQVAQDAASKAKSLAGLTDPLRKVSSVVDTAKNLLSTGPVRDLLPSLGSGSSSGDRDGSGLLLNTKLGDVTVNSITYSMTDKGMDAQASVTAGVIAEGIAGAAVTVLEIQVSMVVTVHISSTHEPANNTCQLEVEQKSMEVTEVCIMLVKTALDMLPMSLPLPISLNDVMLMVLSVELTKNAKESSCAIQLDDFDTGKNVTGAVCQYTIAKTNIYADGLCISYCAKCTWNKIPVSMPGSSIPKHPKNDSVSLILSHETVKEFVTRCAKPVRVKVGDVEACISRLSYGYRPDQKLELIMNFELKKAGQPYGIARSVAMYSHLCRTANGKMVADIKMISMTQQTTMPPEIMDEMPNLVYEVQSRAVSAITGCLSQWNLPTGVSSNPVPPAKLVPMKTKDLQTGK
ncbi:vomeromodulin-like [Sorex fumeus]|uniref:vomeromodulin-like n=1 Tax=Sorex fumeus TaxID=62283 RepID=UPI0024AC9A8E|nr:vomeromodulin-like [Sorex fumeus]